MWWIGLLLACSGRWNAPHAKGASDKHSGAYLLRLPGHHMVALILLCVFFKSGLRRKSNIWMLQKCICILKRALFFTCFLVMWYENNTKHLPLKWNVAYNVIMCIVWLVMVILHLATITLSLAASNLVKSPKTDVARRVRTHLWNMCLTSEGLLQCWSLKSVYMPRTHQCIVIFYSAA